jgi:apolipoprotein N-acyltransferase
MRAAHKKTRKRKIIVLVIEAIKLILLPLLFIFPWVTIGYAFWYTNQQQNITWPSIGLVLLTSGLEVFSNYMLITIPFTVWKMIQRKRLSLRLIIMLVVIAIGLWLLHIAPFGQSIDDWIMGVIS